MKLPSGISSHIVPGVNGLDMHLFEAGDREAPAIILLHGYPELAYSWMKMLMPLANAGFRAIAPDLRGYGRTTGWDADFDGDLRQFRILNVTRDVVALVSALGIRSVDAVAGHDFGASVAAICALVRPDIFKRLVLMTPVPDRRPSPTVRAPGLERRTRSMRNWPDSIRRASTTSGTTRPARQSRI
jgi:pimeloyl-ACP methyl ester carboxylesterase